MSSDKQPIAIPDDLASCQVLVEQLAATIDSQTQTINAQTHEIESHAQTIVELQQSSTAQD